MSVVLSLYNPHIPNTYCYSLLPPPPPRFPSLPTSSLTLFISSPSFFHPSLPPQLGVGSTDHVVVYDRHSEGMMSSPRVWWMFRVSEMHTLLHICWFAGSITNFVVISRGPDILLSCTHLRSSCSCLATLPHQYWMEVS